MKANVEVYGVKRGRLHEEFRVFFSSQALHIVGTENLCMAPFGPFDACKP